MRRLRWSSLVQRQYRSPTAHHPDQSGVQAATLSERRRRRWLPRARGGALGGPLGLVAQAQVERPEAGRGGGVVQAGAAQRGQVVVARRQHGDHRQVRRAAREALVHLLPQARAALSPAARAAARPRPRRRAADAPRVPCSAAQLRGLLGSLRAAWPPPPPGPAARTARLTTETAKPAGGYMSSRRVHKL